MKKIINIKKPKKFIYLDNGASTQIDPQILRLLTRTLNKFYANTKSIHQKGQEAKDLLEKSREGFAEKLKTSPGEIIFTCSSTESNNLALKGVINFTSSKKHLIISNIEHTSITKPAKYLKDLGHEVSVAIANHDGVIDLEYFEKLIQDNTILVSINFVNHELGTVQPIKEIVAVIEKERKRRVKENISTPIYLHVDATQALGHIPINIKELGVDLLTASSHKIYGPKGAGLLYVKKGVKIKPLFHGGEHEYGLRAGSVNLPAIYAFFKAYEISLQRMKKDDQKYKKMKKYIIKEITKNIPESFINGDIKNQLNCVVNMRFNNVEGETLAFTLDHNNIGVSTGSACSVGSISDSSLFSIGLRPNEIQSSIRISLGRFTSQQDIDTFLKILIKSVQNLRKISI